MFRLKKRRSFPWGQALSLNFTIFYVSDRIVLQIGLQFLPIITLKLGLSIFFKKLLKINWYLGYFEIGDDLMTEFNYSLYLYLKWMFMENGAFQLRLTHLHFINSNLTLRNSQILNSIKNQMTYWQLQLYFYHNCCL